MHGKYEKLERWADSLERKIDSLSYNKRVTEKDLQTLNVAKTWITQADGELEQMAEQYQLKKINIERAGTRIIDADRIIGIAENGMSKK